jgi:hydroxyethylthiazole kinase-like uncharacterized protein yjeF
VAKNQDGVQPTPAKGDVVVDEQYASTLIPRRSFGAHKWGVGGVVIVGGAPGYLGAPMLSAMAAQRAGAGIVSLAVPRGIVGSIATAVPEASFLPLSETESAHGARRAAEEIAKKLEKATAIVVGPGLGEDEASDGLMAALFGARSATTLIGFGSSVATQAHERDEGLLAASERPIVIDADGLNGLAKQEDWVSRIPKGRCVLTPHVGEFARLTGKSAGEITEDPLPLAREFAAAWGQTVVLKYGYTVATDGTRAVIAADAPLSLATGGTGDVFAGTIGAFLAQGMAPLDAAALAIYAGSAAARRVEERTGTLGLVASDLPGAIAAELATLERFGKAAS